MRVRVREREGTAAAILENVKEPAGDSNLPEAESLCYLSSVATGKAILVDQVLFSQSLIFLFRHESDFTISNRRESINL